MISSNKTIILSSELFTLNKENGLIVIEDVYNLTLSGGENDSVIECSSQSTFGIHLKNTTNVTLTGLGFRNCGAAIPSELLKYLSYGDVLIYSDVVLPVFNETVFLIEASENITLSRIHIENSTGLALAAVSSPIIKYPNNAFFMKSSYPKTGQLQNI